jgi:hypothetical protein
MQDTAETAETVLVEWAGSGKTICSISKDTLRAMCNNNLLKSRQLQYLIWQAVPPADQASLQEFEWYVKAFWCVCVYLDDSTELTTSPDAVNTKRQKNKDCSFILQDTSLLTVLKVCMYLPHQIAAAGCKSCYFLNCDRYYHSLPRNLQTSEYVALAAASCHGLILRDLPHDLRGNKTIVITCVKQNGLAILDADLVLFDEDLVKSALQTQRFDLLRLHF